MAGSILDEAHIHPAIRQRVETNHVDIVREVQAAIASNDVVVIGMAQNPHVKRTRKTLNAAGIPTSTWNTGATSTAGGDATL